MKKRVEVVDLKKRVELYYRFSITLSVSLFILLFQLFPRYNPHPYKMTGKIGPTKVLPTDPIVKPVVPKELPKKRIPVETENPEEIRNAIIPSDSTLFQRFGEKDPNEIPDPGTFIAFETGPEIIYAAAPEYPKIARVAGIEGRVILQLFVGKDGKPKKVLVLKSEVTEDCNMAAIKAGWSFKFKPAMQRDKPVGVWVSMPVVFRLK